VIVCLALLQILTFATLQFAGSHSGVSHFTFIAREAD